MARCFAILLLSLLLLQAKAQESVLHNSSWFKIAVDHDGVYKINIDAIKKMGFNPDKIDPRKIKIYGNPGGMLPQENNASRPADLIENAIFVSGEDDGKFNKQDFILFYGKGPDASSFDVDQGIFSYEKNLYADFNYYFVTIGDTNGKRLATNDNSGSNLPVINTFDDFAYHEVDLNNILTSGREWFGETFKFNSTQTFNLDMSGIAPGSTIQVVSDVMGRTTSGSSFNVYFNNVKIGEHNISTIANAEDYPYARKGQSDNELFAFSSDAVSASQAQQLKYEYIKGSGDIEAYLNYFLVSSKRTLALYADQTIFSSVESLQNTESAFQIGAVTGNCSVWEITTPGEPSIQPFTISSGQGVFNATTQVLRQFIVFNEKTPAPKLIGKVSNQNLHNLATPNFIIVAYPDFLDEAERLADHRQSHSGWTTAVVTTDQVFNEFSSGRQDVTAIRDFVKYLHDKNSSALKSLLLFGRASYDYKSRLYHNTNFVPTYESRNSLDPLETYSSDDYYGFLEDNEGAWEEDPSVDNTLDIGVGRFPVMNVADAKSVVDKIIDYETNLKSFGNWRKDIVFVADDGDNNAHQSQSDDLAKKVETSNPAFNTHRIFLDSYEQIVKPVGTVSPETNQAITDAITRGALIVNYTGHGGETKWAEEDIFNATSINGLENKFYPLLVTATCVYGRTDDPDNISGAENILTKSMSGAIGLVSTARPVSSNTNFELNTAFYDALFTKESNSYLTL
ncbi:MAG TPA: type IX secretion system sortase PorU, partial [Cyclobacteriaceae bacterium]|nr:type IX secretion system sortase PorU [Cyclobacteriaceae bacterium]